MTFPYSNVGCEFIIVTQWGDKLSQRCTLHDSNQLKLSMYATVIPSGHGASCKLYLSKLHPENTAVFQRLRKHMNAFPTLQGTHNMMESSRHDGIIFGTRIIKQTRHEPLCQCHNSHTYFACWCRMSWNHETLRKWTIHHVRQCWLVVNSKNGAIQLYFTVV